MTLHLRFKIIVRCLLMILKIRLRRIPERVGFNGIVLINWLWRWPALELSCVDGLRLKGETLVLILRLIRLMLRFKSRAVRVRRNLTVRNDLCYTLTLCSMSLRSPYKSNSLPMLEIPVLSTPLLPTLPSLLGEYHTTQICQDPSVDGVSRYHPGFPVVNLGLVYFL